METPTNQEVGFVHKVNKFLVYLDGLPSVKINDLVVNDKGVRGWITALLPDMVEVLLLDEGDVRPGDMFTVTGEKLTLPLGDFLLGRCLNPLGNPLDDGKPLPKSPDVTMAQGLDPLAPSIGNRQFIDQQFDTGMTLVDTLVPLGKGQRELLMGDPRSGKAHFVMDLIANQKNNNVVCVYALVGKPLPEVRNITQSLAQSNSLPYTVVIAASSIDTAPLVFLTPQTAFTIAEHFQKQGKNVLLVLDDMGVHAKIYREIALLASRSPGRESYPGDIFYQHAHLLERGGNFNKKSGGGSITVLPVIELDLNDFSTFIPTNLMGMTDGHLLFRASLASQGNMPAIDVAFSVTRVGRQTQNRVQELLSTHIRQVLAQAAQLETLGQFSFELPPETQLLFKQTAMTKELLRQPLNLAISKEVQTILLGLPFSKWLRDKDLEFVEKNKMKIIETIRDNSEITPLISEVFSLADEKELITRLDSMADVFARLIPVEETIATAPAAAPNPPKPEVKPA